MLQSKDLSQQTSATKLVEETGKGMASQCSFTNRVIQPVWIVIIVGVTWVSILYPIIPGYGIEFDGWQNIPWDFQKVAGSQSNPAGDPSGDHIALIQDYTGNHLAYVNDQRVADNNWHQVTVSVQGSSVSVYVDHGLVLQWTGDLNRTYDGFGFSGATGGVGSNWHLIDDVSINAQNLKTPSLTTSCIGSVSQSSFQCQNQRSINL